MKKRIKNLKQAQDEVVELEDAGHIISMFTDYHWRIDNYIDVWPSSKKYMKQDGNYKIKHFVHLKDIFRDISN